MLPSLVPAALVVVTVLAATLALGVSASLKSTSEFQATAKVLIRRAEGSPFQRGGMGDHGAGVSAAAARAASVSHAATRSEP